MAHNLKDYFPVIRTREEVEKCIREDKHLRKTFNEWELQEREEFLDICTGVHGAKMLYDGFFKEVMNPEYAPERLSDFLSLVLKKQIRVMKVLPNDSSRLTDESSLLIMDIVVEFEDGGIANIEVQKLGYLFPGQRSACYSADLLLRQYKRLRNEKKKKFSYRDIQTVYTIVLFEKSPKEFQEKPGLYYHRVEHKVNTGVKLDIPQKFVYLSLDIFKKKQHNEGEKIHNKLEAWLTFFSRDEPDMILKLIEQYPEFRPLYEDVYELCRNVEEVMQVFSKELLEMDRNTVKLMIDEMEEELQEKKEILKEQVQRIEEQDQRIEEQDRKMEEKNQKIAKQEQQMLKLNAELKQSKSEMAGLMQRIAELEKILMEK
ncbi:PD-(D/E)XK nuclease family transposase [Frisingicoccus sp.]|uniref:PD-(D/E)XK nuclease family transposase n=1 Tax=Frisingicoccus sp. TaxID=1918627 RepID=UPI003AB8AA79